MKKLVLFAFCLCSVVTFAQKFDTIKLPNGNITITPELAKEILLYSNIRIEDSVIIGRSNFICMPPECETEMMKFEDLFPEYYLYAVSDRDLVWYESNHADDEISKIFKKFRYYYSDLTEGYAIITNKKKLEESCEYCEDRYLALLEGPQYALVDKQGKICIPFKKFDKLTQGVYEGLVTACKDGKWGFANPDGIVKIKLQYEDARHFSEGLAAVKKHGRWGYIDKKGEVVIPFNYTFAGDFKRGVAVVMTKEVNGKSIATGLIDHSGRSSFDILVDEGLKEYDGPYLEEKEKTSGTIKYTYYEDEKENRIKHGYYLFQSDYYYVDGHYKNGVKNGVWVEQWRNYQITDYWPFLHYNEISNGNRQWLSINYNYGIPEGHFCLYLMDEVWPVVSGNCKNGSPNGEIYVSGQTFQLDKAGAVTGTIEYEDYGYTGEIPKTVTLLFYKGVPMEVEEYDKSTGKRKVLFQYEGFTAVDDIKEVVSNGVHLYKIGDNYYELEPKDPRYPFDLFDVQKYSKKMAEDMSFILNLPASWPIKEIQSPQLNFFKRASRDKIKKFEWPKYSNIFVTYSEYSQAYDQGDAVFEQRVEEKLEAKRISAYNLNKHLFLSKDEFVSYYEQGEDTFYRIVKKREADYANYNDNVAWFVDFSDYLNNNQDGNIQEEIFRRKTIYEEYKEYFPDMTKYITLYVQGEDVLTAEINKRRGVYERCKDPDGGYIFKNMSDFLPYYLSGTADDEYAKRRFLYKVDDFASLNIKGESDNKKEKYRRFFDYLDECVAISPNARPQLIEIMVSKNKKMSEEWEENGKYFNNVVEFYEAYISDDYKSILKSKKK